MIVQMPEEMSLIPADEDGKFPYLMQFMDGNRIDLTLAPVELINNFVRQDSLSKLLLDKDNCMEGFPPASDKDYLIKKAYRKEFWIAVMNFGGVVRMWQKGYGERNFLM